MTSSVETTSTSGPETTGGVSEGTTGTSGEPPPPNCGDGSLDPGEECDDGILNGPGEACNENCTLNVCGDGVQGPAESCDLGPDNGPDNGCSSECEILPTSCGVQEAEAELIPRPVDIIVTIDNSGSMGAEIQGVQDNINVNFAQILENSGLDYRVILVSKYGNLASESVCIESPLGGIAPGGCANPPQMAINGPRFFHYSLEIASHDSWCRLLATLKGNVKDQFNFAPMGWQTWLRPDAFKIFLELTDDGANCSYGGVSYNDSNSVNGGNTAATKFDTSLRAADPLHFGDSPENRNYKWYSIVGMAYNNPPEQPYTPMDPVLTGECPSAQDPGTGYQALSNLTGGLRFPLCDTSKYDVVFQEIANGVIADAKIACEFDIPEAPMGKLLDQDSIVVNFTPQGQNPVVLGQVPSVDQCGPMSFYVSGNQVILCPEACALAQNDKDAELKVEFTCEPLTPG